MTKWYRRRYRGAVVLRNALLTIATILTVILIISVMSALSEMSAAAAWPSELRLNPIDWTGVGAIAGMAAIILNLSLLVSVIIGFRSVREGQVSREAQILQWAAQQMDNVKPDEVVIRNAGTDFSNWNDETRASAQRVCNAYQRMCYMAENGLIHPDHFRAMWGVNLVIYWRRLKDFVYAERARFGDHATAKDGAYLRADFEAFAQETEEMFRQSHPQIIDRYLKSP